MDLPGWKDRWRRFWGEGLWRDHWGRFWLIPVKAFRVVILAWWGLLRNRSLVRASALAYATILALIPLLALLFAVFKGLGLQRLLASHLLEGLAPGSKEFARQILEYIESTQVTSLGVFGVVFLLGALVVVMANVERAFNETWRVPYTRHWLRKLSDYLSIFLIFPILIAMAISVTTGVLGHPEVRRLLSQILPEALLTASSGLVSLVVLWLAFTFIYLVMPNTRVRFSSAVLGGVVGGSLWLLAQAVFAKFTGLATYYNAIYGALYHLLFLVIWIFWSWLIVLFGTEVAFAHQNLERLGPEAGGAEAPPEPVDEYLALAVLTLIGSRFARGQPPLSLTELGGMLSWPPPLPGNAVQVLKDCGVIMEVSVPGDEEVPRYMLRHPLEQITIQGILKVLGQARGAAVAQALSGAPDLAGDLKRLVEEASPGQLAAMTLKDLVSQGPAVPAAASPEAG